MKEIVFADTRRKRQVAALPGIVRVTSLNILDVTMRLYALRVLRAHGMCDMALQAICKSVVVAKLLYALSGIYCSG